MKPDVLDAAAASLRDAAHRLNVSPDEGAARVLSEVRARARRRRFAYLALVQMGMIFIGFGAWAAGTGRLSSFVRDGFAARIHERTARPSARSRPPVQVVPEEPRAVAPPDEGGASPPPLGEAPQEAPRLQDRPLPRKQPKRPAIALAKPSTAGEGLYQAAHEAHFARKDWAAAVPLWDAYLASGDLRFSIEARYNRALALVRLGQKREASEALRPFAQGEYGAYRRNDAQRLLQWIEGLSP